MRPTHFSSSRMEMPEYVVTSEKSSEPPDTVLEKAVWKSTIRLAQGSATCASADLPSFAATMVCHSALGSSSNTIGKNLHMGTFVNKTRTARQHVINHYSAPNIDNCYHQGPCLKWEVIGPARMMILHSEGQQ